VMLFAESQKRRELTVSARELVREHYDWSAIGKLLCGSYLEWFGLGPAE
jgi:hypothetical protein